MANGKLEALLAEWRQKRLLILGLGVSNRPLARLLLEAGCRVTGCDRTDREKLDREVLDLEEQGLELRLGAGYLENLEADVVFRTPGMHPANPALEALRRRGAAVTSEMEIFFQVCPCPVIAVTGSDGKTTTTTLLAEMLRAAGKTVWVGGNIGKPLLPEVGRMAPSDWAVVELSSFQLMDMDRSGHIAVVTNLAPNHLDVHKDMAEYVEAKEHVFAYQSEGDILILNRDHEITRSFAPGAPGQVRWFSRRERPERGVFLEDGVIYRATPEGVREIMAQRDILLPGLHNVENYMAALAALEGLVSDETARQVARTFKGVEHRIELVREKDGVRFYNDSIASSPSRTMAGLRSFRQKVILIAGGYDKHIPYDVLGPDLVAHVKALVLTGATAPKIRAAAVSAPGYDAAQLPIYETEGFAAAFHQAVEVAQPGDIVILSPASASFDQFKNFMVRGDTFKKLVMDL